MRFWEQTLPLNQRGAAVDAGLVLRLVIGWRDKGADVQRDHVFPLPLTEGPTEPISPHTVSTILPQAPLLPLSAAAATTSALQSPSQVRHLRPDSVLPRAERVIAGKGRCLSPTYRACADRVPIFWAGSSALTTTSTDIVASPLFHSPRPKMTRCLGRGSGMWT